MAIATREEIRNWVVLALQRRGVAVRHLEIIPLGQDGGWRIGPAMLPSISDPAVKMAADATASELGSLYQLERRPSKRRVVLDFQKSKHGPLNVLVAEDNVLTADLIAEALAAQGCIVVGPFGRLEDSLEAASKQTNLAGALLDIDLHGEASFPVARDLQARGVPFAFVTAYPDIVVPEDLRGAPRFSKPFAPWELAAAAVEKFSPQRGGAHLVERSV
jgi:CheY-like chemotaxis protein